MCDGVSHVGTAIVYGVGGGVCGYYDGGGMAVDGVGVYIGVSGCVDGYVVVGCVVICGAVGVGSCGGIAVIFVYVYVVGVCVGVCVCFFFFFFFLC